VAIVVIRKVILPQHLQNVGPTEDIDGDESYEGVGALFPPLE